MATVTREDIRNWMVDHFEIGHRAVHDGGTVTTPADDSEFGGFGGQERVENGAELLITSGTRDGDLCRVSKRPTLSGGVITCDPPPGGSLANGDTFTVLYRPWKFNDVHDCINQALVEYVPEKLRVPSTRVVDGDMLASGVTDWTDSNASSAKAAASIANHGLRTIAVTDSGSGSGYTRSASIGVEPGASYYLEAVGMIDSAGAATSAGLLVLFDVTNSAAITLDEDDIDTFEPQLLRNNVTIPSGCEQVQVRLTTVTASAVIRWAYVILRKNEWREFQLLDRMEPDRVGKVFIAHGSDWATRTFEEVDAYPYEVGAGLWKMRTESNLSGQSVWYEDHSRRSALTSDSSTTSATTEEVASVAAWLLLRQREGTERWERQLRKAKDRAAALLSKRRASERTYKRIPHYHVLPAV